MSSAIMYVTASIISLPVGAGWRCGGIVKCVLNWGLCGDDRREELFIFEFLCSFTTWSCITLRVDFKWLNKLVVFHWGADTVMWHILHNIFVCSESDSLKSKCFNTTEFALPFFQTKGCISAIFYCFIYTFFQNTHWQYASAWLKATIFRQGIVGCTGGDGRVHCIYHTRQGVRQNDRFIAIILFSWSREAKIKIEIQLMAQPE